MQVSLVGGGPGRTSMLTLEACTALRRADVIFFAGWLLTDNLDELAPGAELIDVGKAHLPPSGSQTSICDQLVDRARAGQSVVRLKGGDPFVFGRGGEEILACLTAGVPVPIVPGVSSALFGARGLRDPGPSSRGSARAFTVISGHTSPPEPTSWER